MVERSWRRRFEGRVRGLQDRRPRSERHGPPPRDVGPLALPLPSPTATAESLDDGSLQIKDTLAPEHVAEFMLRVADSVRTGEIEPPAWFAVGTPAGGSVRVDRGPANDEGAERIASAIARIGAAVSAGGDEPPRWFAFALDCGCGVRIERREGSGA